MRETDNEVFMTRSLNVTPKTTEQHLIVRSGKSEAEVTTNGRVQCTQYIALVNKLATGRDRASRGLSATAELFVFTYSHWLCPLYYRIERDSIVFS